MARISKAEHSRILHLVDGEGRKVAEVAAEYGCTPANIYALLSKLRRNAGAAAEPEAPPPAVTEAPAPAEAPADDLFAAVAAPVAEEQPAPVPAPAPPSAPLPASAPASATVTELPRRSPAGGVGMALARPGYGLVMRTAEGDESLTPFRSLDDLLSAIKPVLRGAARSPDPVWFSIQPVDLASLDSDAA